MKYYHVDVFTDKKFSGNGLTIFIAEQQLDKALMQTLTGEMRQFESIFLSKIESNRCRAFIFTTEEELDFAGHPIIGAAATLHDIYAPHKAESNWIFELNEKSVSVSTRLKNGLYAAKMNQGSPVFIKTLSETEAENFMGFLNLTPEDRYAGMPLEVISTGLPYLILPVKSSSLQKTGVTIKDLESRLLAIGAKFFFVLDVENRQGRTWDNSGLVEDIATGSAAGPVGAYLVKNGMEQFDVEIMLHQGAFLGRPSKLKVLVTKEVNDMGDIYVEGDVCKIAYGELIL